MSSVKDIVALAKPTITALSLLMCAAGLWLAGAQDLTIAIAALVGTGLAVASANALNMAIEHDVDKLMPRTANRPIPAGRMRISTAVIVGVVFGILGLIMLGMMVNGLTALLGAIALVGYVAVYTPLKKRTPLALVIGAVPGAMPPLMGWTAVTNTIDPAGLVLFGVLFIWQIPHFIAIAVRRKAQYARAGIKIVTVIRGNRIARMQALAYATALLPLSLLLVPLGYAGWIYFATSLGSGIWFWWAAFKDVDNEQDMPWAKRLFGVSLLYLPVWMAGICLDLTLV